ncbi:MAG TPA: recombinase family protein [Bryobacteraceae bacterium]|nr:recombinase family protein [Bryobacteraceae bacterium]
MAKPVRLREPLTGSPTLEHINQRMSAGWKLVALEWEREATAEGEISEPQEGVEEIPYGLQVSSDGLRLVENPTESQIIIRALDMIVEDCPLSQIADDLNRRGFRTREGKQWNPAALFNLLPRMIEVGPRVFVSEAWTTRRQRLPRVV